MSCSSCEIEDYAAPYHLPTGPGVGPVGLQLLLVPHDDVVGVVVEVLLALVDKHDPLGVVELRRLLLVQLVVVGIAVVGVVVRADLVAEA